MDDTFLTLSKNSDGDMHAAVRDLEGEAKSNMFMVAPERATHREWADFMRIAYRMWRNSHPDGHLWPLPEHVIPPVE